jgi:hypothetical protein
MPKWEYFEFVLVQGNGETKLLPSKGEAYDFHEGQNLNIEFPTYLDMLGSLGWELVSKNVRRDNTYTWHYYSFKRFIGASDVPS